MPSFTLLQTILTLPTINRDVHKPCAHQDQITTNPTKSDIDHATSDKHTQNPTIHVMMLSNHTPRVQPIHPSHIHTQTNTHTHPSNTYNCRSRYRALALVFRDVHIHQRIYEINTSVHTGRNRTLQTNTRLPPTPTHTQTHIKHYRSSCASTMGLYGGHIDFILALSRRIMAGCT